MVKEIKEDYISLKIAKLLKEKGFNWECKIAKFYPEPWYDQESPDGVYAPTLQMAMKWLREVHKLYIEICTDKALNLKDIVFRPAIFNNELSCLWESDNYPTYEQAAEAAIKYCLTNII